MRGFIGSLLCAGVLVSLIGCGGADKRYVAVLSPLNTQVSGNPMGTAEFIVTGDRLVARVDVVGLDDTVHPQFIRSGDLCPGASVDRNGDGFIDVVEGSSTFGTALIPLDSDLSDSTPGEEEGFPNIASYRYEAEVGLDTLFNDLRTDDPNPDDDVVKLSEEEISDRGPLDSIDLNARTFVIHGVDDALPESVATVGEAEARRLLPVACGNIVDVE